MLLTQAIILRVLSSGARLERSRCSLPCPSNTALRAQQFVDACFERAGSTQRALRLLRQFRAVLFRESSRAHLDAKYAAIFARYTADLEGVSDSFQT